MPITDELLMSTAPSSNTTLGSAITLDGTVMTPSQVDDAIRELMAYRARATTRHVTKAAGSYSAAKADHNQFWRCTGAVTINLTAAATLTDGWCLWVRADGGAVTIDPNGAETINGSATSLVIPNGANAFIICTGAAFHTLYLSSALAATSGTIDGVVTGGTTPAAGSFTALTAGGLVDISGLGASQVKFGNANNSSNNATLDGYTDWISYTPTFTGFGTVSAVSIWSKRVGDTLYIRGKFTSGTSTAVEARMTLGFNGVNGGVNSDATKVPSIQQAGLGSYGVASPSQVRMLIESNVGYVTFGVQDTASAGLTKQLANAFLPTGTVLSIQAEIPISGW